MGLFIICGHGAGDPGATGNGYQEAERVRALASRIKHFGGEAVIIGDTSVKWSKSRYLTNKNVPKGSLVLELHMDSSTSKSAKGGHVIIKDGLTADKYDKALAGFISSILPGRSKTIVGRNDLMNPNMAASAGINYRLMECGFISNANDVKIFNSKMDEIAKGILKCFDITPKETAAVVHDDERLTVNGVWDKALTLRLQEIFGTTKDGIVSNQWAMYKDDNPGLTTGWDWDQKANGKGSALIKAMQKYAGMPEKDRDGEIGPKTFKAFQKKWGTYVDGYISKPSNFVKALQRWANNQ